MTRFLRYFQYVRNLEDQLNLTREELMEEKMLRVQAETVSKQFEREAHRAWEQVAVADTARDEAIKARFAGMDALVGTLTNAMAPKVEKAPEKMEFKGHVNRPKTISAILRSQDRATFEALRSKRKPA